MASMPAPQPGRFDGIKSRLADILDEVGQLCLFGLELTKGVFRGTGGNTLAAVCYNIGVTSIPVVGLTGLFIGMVLAVQSYAQFAVVGMETRLGSIINISIVRELGPVLAATMLAGRVGSAIAAELATMKITEQVDALACLGVNPVHYLGAPRLLACTVLIPLLTILANFMGVLGGSIICIHVYHIDSFHYWHNAQGYIGMWDLTTGLIKPTFFGATIAIISCDRGLKSEAGAEGVGQAATKAFVASFIAILVIDFFLAMLLNQLYVYLWPSSRGFV